MWVAGQEIRDLVARWEDSLVHKEEVELVICDWEFFDPGG
jgi:hypothetical protein